MLVGITKKPVAFLDIYILALQNVRFSKQIHISHALSQLINGNIWR